MVSPLTWYQARHELQTSEWVTFHSNLDSSPGAMPWAVTKRCLRMGCFFFGFFTAQTTQTWIKTVSLLSVWLQDWQDTAGRDKKESSSRKEDLFWQNWTQKVYGCSCLVANKNGCRNISSCCILLDCLLYHHHHHHHDHHQPLIQDRVTEVPISAGRLPFPWAHQSALAGRYRGALRAVWRYFNLI